MPETQGGQLDAFWTAHRATRQRASDLADARRLVREMGHDAPQPLDVWVRAASLADLPTDAVLTAARAAHLVESEA